MAAAIFPCEKNVISRLKKAAIWRNCPIIIARKTVMKRNVLFVIGFLLVTVFTGTSAGAKISAAQSGDIPPFKMMQTNGIFFGAADLARNKPVVLIYFSPDCDHCLTLMNGLFKKINEFKNTQLVLVSFKPVEELASFERSYNTRKYPFIKVGTEGTSFFLRYYYKIETTPFTAVYNKAGKLVASYRKTTPLDALIAQVKQLK